MNTPNHTPTLFDQIIARELPADIVYEDEHCLAFRDVNPQAPVHVLLIPKRCIDRIGHAQSDDATLLGHMMTCIPKITQKLGIPEDFRVVINNGQQAGQTVFHLHMHLLGGRDFSWPPG